MVSDPLCLRTLPRNKPRLYISVDGGARTGRTISHCCPSVTVSPFTVHRRQSSTISPPLPLSLSIRLSLSVSTCPRVYSISIVFFFPFFFLLLLLLRRYFHSTSFHFLHPPSYFTLQLLILPLSPPWCASFHSSKTSFLRLLYSYQLFSLLSSASSFPSIFFSLSLSLHCNLRLFVHILSSVLILEFLFYCFLENDCKIFRSKKRMDGNRIKEERSGKKNMGREDLNRLDSWSKSGRRLKKCSPFGEDLKWSAGRVRKKFLHSSFAKHFERGWEWGRA